MTAHTTPHATLDLHALTAVTGGARAADPSITINPTLVCPAGTSPYFTDVRGKVNVNTPSGIGVNGEGSYTHFECTPVKPDWKRPGGDR
jgi:hypothetical protein